MACRTVSRSAFALLPLVILAAATASRAQGDGRNYKMDEVRIGDTVSVDAGMIGKWESCTVTAVKPDSVDRSTMDNMTVRCSNGRIYQPMANAQMVRKGGGAGVAAGPATAGRYAAPATGQTRTSTRTAATSGLASSPRQAIEHYYGSQTVEWHNLQIGAPRTIAPSDAVPLEIRGGTTVYPALAMITTNSAGTIRDIVQTFYVYKNEFGGWVAAPYASGAVRVQVRGEYGH